MVSKIYKAYKCESDAYKYPIWIALCVNLFEAVISFLEISVFILTVYNLYIYIIRMYQFTPFIPNIYKNRPNKFHFNLK